MAPMGNPKKTSEYLLGQCARYPELMVQDLLKALHQSVFGCGHFVQDPQSALRRITQELDALSASPYEAAAEPLDGAFCRLPLQYVLQHALAPKTLLRLFILSAQPPCGSLAELEEKLAVLLGLAESGRLPFSLQDVIRAVDGWRQAGFPACRHSARFRAAYAPAYRVIRREYVPLLPLLAVIDQHMAQTPRLLAAIEGGSASGKTTLAALLQRIYDAQVFHMDDFFLRPEQRTPERLAEPGGNVDRERFFSEVLLPLSQGRTVAYRPYSCGTQSIGAPRALPPKALNIVEGAYSMHPALAEQYGLTVFLRICPQLQRQRILARNTPAEAERFFSTWIPLEERYFEATAPQRRCTLIWEAAE